MGWRRPWWGLEAAPGVRARRGSQLPEGDSASTAAAQAQRRASAPGEDRNHHPVRLQGGQDRGSAGRPRPARIATPRRRSTRLTLSGSAGRPRPARIATPTTGSRSPTGSCSAGRPRPARIATTPWRCAPAAIPAAAPGVRARRGSQLTGGADPRGGHLAAPGVRARRGSQPRLAGRQQHRAHGAAPGVRARRGSQLMTALTRTTKPPAAPGVRARRGSQLVAVPEFNIPRRVQRRASAPGEDRNHSSSVTWTAVSSGSAGRPRPARIATPAGGRVPRSAGAAPGVRARRGSQPPVRDD